MIQTLAACTYGRCRIIGHFALAFDTTWRPVVFVVGNPLEEALYHAVDLTFVSVRPRSADDLFRRTDRIETILADGTSVYEAV